MNKILFLISAIALAACGGSSVWYKANKEDPPLEVGKVKLQPGECKPFSGGFLGIGSEWPGSIGEGDNKVKKDEGHWIVITKTQPGKDGFNIEPNPKGECTVGETGNDNGEETNGTDKDGSDSKDTIDNTSGTGDDNPDEQVTVE